MVQPQSRRAVILASLIVLLAAPAERSVSAHMAITVEPTRVLIGHAGEFVPRFATYLPNSLTVKAGETVDLPADATYDAVEIAGTLRVSRTGTTTLRTTHLMILPGGRLDAGTEDDPITGSFRLIIRDVPIDTARDPFQWGNGLVNFGQRSIVGVRRTAWAPMQEAPAGATTISVDECGGCQVGDDLLFTDTRPGQRQKETPKTIAGIAGNVLTLSAPLDFAHPVIHTPQGADVIRPRVAVLTRNVVIASENPAGTRGHGADVGELATADVFYVRHVGVGRTCGEVLDSTTLNLAHIGTCQVGRYGFGHAHHPRVGGIRYVGNVYEGTLGSRWAIAIHQGHDAVVDQNVCLEYLGGCLATEDGPETRNRITRNLAAFNKATRTRFALADRNINEGAPGTDSAMWFRGVAQVIDGNESWNNVGVGINLINMLQVGIGTLYPSQSGGPIDTVYTEAVARAAVPISFVGNVSVGNSGVGLEHWSLGRFPADGYIGAHNAIQVAVILAGGAYLRNATLVCGDSADSYGVNSSAAYSSRVDIEDSYVGGCAVGLENALGRDGAIVKNVVLQNRTNIELADTMPTGQFLLDHVRYVRLGSFPPRHIVLSRYTAPWKTGEEYPRADAQHWMPQTGSPFVVIAHDGVEGRDFQLLALTQQRSGAAWRQYNSVMRSAPPECGETQGETWDRCGMSFRRDVYAPDEVVQLEGLINGVARPGRQRSLGPPRGILTFPTYTAPAEVQDVYQVGPSTVLTVQLTGQPTAGGLTVTVDGATPIQIDATDPQERRYRTRQVAQGPHTVVIDRPGGERMTFTYLVGDAAPPPPPPPGEICGDGLDNDGDGLIDEDCPIFPNCTVGAVITDASGAIWTMSASRPGAQILRNGQLTGGIDWAAPYDLTLFNGSIYVNIAAAPKIEWWATLAVETPSWQSKSAPACGQ